MYNASTYFCQFCFLFVILVVFSTFCLTFCSEPFFAKLVIDNRTTSSVYVCTHKVRLNLLPRNWVFQLVYSHCRLIWYLTVKSYVLYVFTLHVLIK